MQTFRKGLVIAIISALIGTLLCFSASAFETDEKIAFYDNGLESMNMSYGQYPTKRYGSIYVPETDNVLIELSVIADAYSDWVQYDIGIDFTMADDVDIYIPYLSERTVTPYIEVTKGQEQFAGFNVELKSIPINTYRGFYPSGNGFTTTSYLLTTTPTQKCVHVHLTYADGHATGADTNNVQVRVYFNGGNVSAYLHGYNNLWQAIDGAINQHNIEIVGGYIRSIVNVNFIYQLFIVQIIFIVIGLAYNWLKSL